MRVDWLGQKRPLPTPAHGGRREPLGGVVDHRVAGEADGERAERHEQRGARPEVVGERAGDRRDDDADERGRADDEAREAERDAAHLVQVDEQERRDQAVAERVQHAADLQRLDGAREPGAHGREQAGAAARWRRRDAHGSTLPGEAWLTAQRRPSSCVSALLACLLLAPIGCGGSHPPVPALRAVDELTVKGRAPLTGYERAQFGSGWVDVDRNGCDTRDDILRRDLGRCGCGRAPTAASSSRAPCTTRTPRRPSTTCAAAARASTSTTSWRSATPGRRARSAGRARGIELADDPLNLLAVSASQNRQKGDGDTATWLPANRRSAAPTSPGRSRSSAATASGSPPPSRPPCDACCSAAPSRRSRRASPGRRPRPRGGPAPARPSAPRRAARPRPPRPPAARSRR